MGVDQSYKLHEENSWDSNGKRDTEENIKLWKRRDTVDYWCHQRKFDKMLPLINNDKSAKWLTVGDGRYCSDARYKDHRPRLWSQSHAAAHRLHA